MIPSSIKIGVIHWPIVLSNTLLPDGNLGSCYEEISEIHLSKASSESTQEELFIHELLHACCRFGGVEQDEKVKLTEEQFIRQLSPILHTVLRENGFWPKKI